MPNEVSRRQFLRSGLATAAGAALFGLGFAPKAAAGIYTPGTYTAVSRGKVSDVTVTMTFDADSITDVKVDVSGETQGIGAAIGEKMEQALLAGQTWEIDGVTGATETSDAVRKAAAACVAQATGSEVIIEDNRPTANADWLGEEPEVPEESITAEFECDVLVVGAGTSGSFAACAAVEEGAKTILIERFNHDMASGIRDTLAACGSKQQLADGDDVDKERAINHLCNWSQGYTRRSLARLWADNSGETMDWFTDRLAEGGVRFLHEIDDHELPSNYEFLDVGHSTQYSDVMYYAQLSMDKLLDYATPLGLEIHYETTMVKLEKDGERVCGIIAVNAEGEFVRYRTAKGVVVATGGYGANMEMVAALQPQTLEQICVNYNKSGSKGDGIKACLWAGAVMDTVHTPMIFDRGAVKPDQQGLPGQSVPGGWFWMGSQPFLKVNLRGERFMNEYQPYDYVLHQAAMQPAHTYVTVWDSTFESDIERFATHGCSRLYPHENGADPVFPMGMIVGMNEGLEAEGYIQRADTLEELAEKLNLPVETFMKTVERYNELAAKGEDEDFGKEGYRLSTLDSAPFFGTRQCGGYFICTMDGIQIDDNLHAIRADGSPIEGLYVVGDCSGNYFAGSYPNLMGGAAAGRSTTFGRLAGKFAAKGI
ncbi:MAG: FAD-dependent oxidoreductase [Oscillospiraceae bacterium]|nr:FAD-dependent oxidoreductase [Oscillospiraceae bacterium]